ncbi:unnamed protein product [Blepharisma stoltei]|uniref:Aquaporin n=1 Tax=Blepharisma stoltei TaxID=1481888 RepID=A0AAU9K2V6_9CILI|nr:unnamed protein product [Blepharisma stoltei]
MLFRRLCAEFAGVFLIVFTSGVSGGEPFAVCGAIWCGQGISGLCSGAHFNPAVTIALLYDKYLNKKVSKIDVTDALLYIVTQFIAALFSALCAWGIVHHNMFFDALDDYSIAQAFWAELIFTMLICANAVMMGKMWHIDKVVFNAAIVLTVFGSISTVGHITNGCFNPAIGLGVNIYYYIKHGTHFENTWIFIIAPSLGGIIGALFTNFFTVEMRKRNIIK